MEGDLLGFLLAQQDSAQAIYLASLTPEELAELQKSALTSGSSRFGRKNALEGVRRRMVYLSRRDNMLYDPPQGAAEAAEARFQAAREQRAKDEAEIKLIDEQLEAQGLLKVDSPDSTSGGNSEFLLEPDPNETVPDGAPVEGETEEKKDDEKKDDDDGRYDLRSP